MRQKEVGKRNIHSSPCIHRSTPVGLGLSFLSDLLANNDANESPMQIGFCPIDLSAATILDISPSKLLSKAIDNGKLNLCDGHPVMTIGGPYPITDDGSPPWRIVIFKVLGVSLGNSVDTTKRGVMLIGKVSEDSKWSWPWGCPILVVHWLYIFVL